MTWKYHENKSFYLIHHVTKVIVCTLAVNQNTLTVKQQQRKNLQTMLFFQTVHLYVNHLLCFPLQKDRDYNREKYQNLQNILNALIAAFF